MTFWTNLTAHLLTMAPPPSTTSAAVEQPPIWVTLGPFVLIFIMFYFVLIRPQVKRQKEHDAMVKAVSTGDRVIAAGGIYGTISNVKEDSVILKVAEGVKFEVQRSSIINVLKPGSESKPETPAENNGAKESK